MTDEIENVIPDDTQSETPDAVVIIEEKKPDDKKEETVVSTEPKDAATEGAEAIAKNLEKKLEQERTQRIAAEQRAKQAETKAATAQTKIGAAEQQNIDANRNAATNAKLAAETVLAQSKKLAAELQAEGKFEEAEEERLKAFEAKQEINKATDYLTQLDAYIANPEKVAAEKPSAPVSDDKGTVDPVTGMKFTPRTFAYIQAQGDNWKDQDFRVACDAAQRAANRKGIKPDTDEWESFMDEKLVAMGYKDASESEGEPVVIQEQPKPKPVAKKPAGASAGPSPSRAVPGTTGVAKTQIKLSGAEREVAEAIFKSLPDEFKDTNPDVEYAKNKKALLDEYGEGYGVTSTGR